jgi:V8-like Glu-specific endopeptidase
MNYKMLVAAGLAATASQSVFAAPALNAEFASPKASANAATDDAPSLAPLRAPTSISVTANGITATATKLIVGTGSTGTAVAVPPGDPIYNGRQPAHSGVAQLTMNFAGVGSFVCSGALMQDRIHVLTAAHCVSDGAGTPNPTTTTVRFNRSSDPDTVVQGAAASSNIAVMSAAQYFVHPDYTGEVIDQNDIAIIRLTQAAPNWVQSYRISPVFNLRGNQFEVAGYGRRGTGGATGATLGTGRLRSGENEWDFRFGAGVFQNFFTARRINGENFFGTADIDYSYVSDFDGPNGANNASCLVASVFTTNLGRYCDGAIGPREATTAGGDSGGPNFINGRLAGITSYGLSFGPAFGDIGGGLNSSFGEFAGVVPVNIHRNFIQASTGIAVPEPSSWAMLIAGFGLIGATLRRRRAAMA